MVLFQELTSLGEDLVDHGDSEEHEKHAPAMFRMRSRAALMAQVTTVKNNPEGFFLTFGQYRLIAIASLELKISRREAAPRWRPARQQRRARIPPRPADTTN